MGSIIDNYSDHGVSSATLELASEAEESLKAVYESIDDIVTYNELKVLEAFRAEQFSDTHMGQTTGYGYDDIGRERIERVFARAMGAQKAYVRVQISSGTQAVSAMLWACLRPGDEMLSVTGRPYDTLMSTIGIGSGKNDMALTSYGVTYNELDLLPSGDPDQ